MGASSRFDRDVSPVDARRYRASDRQFHGTSTGAARPGSLCWYVPPARLVAHGCHAQRGCRVVRGAGPFACFGSEAMKTPTTPFGRCRWHRKSSPRAKCKAGDGIAGGTEIIRKDGIGGESAEISIAKNEHKLRFDRR